MNTILDKIIIQDIKTQTLSTARKDKTQVEKSHNVDKVHSKDKVQAEKIEDKVQAEKLKEVIEDRLKDARDTIRQMLKEVSITLNKEFRLEIDEELHIVIAKIIDAETNEVIRQIPPEELIELSKNMESLKSGILINKTC